MSPHAKDKHNAAQRPDQGYDGPEQGEDGTGHGRALDLANDALGNVRALEDQGNAHDHDGQRADLGSHAGQIHGIEHSAVTGGVSGMGHDGASGQGCSGAGLRAVLANDVDELHEISFFNFQQKPLPGRLSDYRSDFLNKAE